jgi:tetratricopeptide (TPR) repeat protein
MHPARSLIMLLVGSMLGSGTHASILLPPKLTPMPVQELVQILEARGAQGDLAAWAELARVHALAYALKTEVAQTEWAYLTDGAPQLRWYHGGDPFERSTPAADAGQEQVARAHREQACTLYVSALAVSPDDLQVRLEYARLLDHSRDQQQAIAQYRQVIELQALRQPVPDVVIDARFIIRAPSTKGYAMTAARHLISLLDPGRDRGEIQRLRELSTPPATHHHSSQPTAE